MKLINFSNFIILSYFFKFSPILIFISFINNHINYINCTSVTLGIDWGEEYVEASIAFRGHRPDILLTGTGSRKFENAVYLLGDTRLFDKEASSFAVKDPSKTLQKSAHLLGIPFTSGSKWSRVSTLKASDVAETLKKKNVSFHWDYTPYEFGVSKDGQLHLKVLKDSMVGLEEATAHFFNHLKNVALEKLVSVKAIESIDSELEMLAVISIPCNYTQNQRKALVFAAESAGLTVVDLVHGITAAAWFNTLEMPPGTRKILYYDLGSSGANVGVVETRVPQEKSKEFPQIRTLSCVTYPGIGGRQHDLLLAEYLRDKFESDNNLKLMPGNPRSLQKLLKSVNKAKMKLTLSETATVEIDNLVKNKHLNVKVTRSEYDKILDPVLQELKAPLDMALEKANLKLKDLDSVEMLGGAWRVPSVTSKLSKLVSPLQLGFHLNAEESIAMGCGYLAAAHNPFFRMKKIELFDNSVFDYVLHVKGQDLDKKVTLYKSTDRLNTSKTVKVNTMNDFNITLYETYKTKNDNNNNNSNSNNNEVLPNDVKVLDYKITGVADMMMSQREDRLGQVSLAFKTENGVIRLQKVLGRSVKKAMDKKETKGKKESTKSKDKKEETKQTTAQEGSIETESPDEGNKTKETEQSETQESTSGDDSVKEKEVPKSTKSDQGSEDVSKGGESSGETVSPPGDDVNKSPLEDKLKDLGSKEYQKDQNKTEEQSLEFKTPSGTEGKDNTGDKKDYGVGSPNASETLFGGKEQGFPSKDENQFESLKDRLMSKLDDDQIQLEFVDNTVELYHFKKLSETKKNIEVLVNRDKAALEKSNLKNRLESTLYKYKGALKMEEFKAACRPNEEESLKEKVMNLLQWFDEHSYSASSDTLNKHLKDLNNLGLPIYTRMNNNLNRESLVKSTDQEFSQLQEKLNDLLKEKPFLKEQTATLDLFEKNLSWWDQVKNDQAKRPLHEEGLFDANTVKSKLDLNRLFLKNLQQIKPPPDPSKEAEKSSEPPKDKEGDSSKEEPKSEAKEAEPGKEDTTTTTDKESQEKKLDQKTPEKEPSKDEKHTEL